jgi:hypothetical protein
MIFLTYEFICFGLAFYALYYLATLPGLRLAIVIVSSLLFQWYYGGWASVAPVVVLAIVTFLAGRTGSPRAILAAIVLCAAVLITYKYTPFLAVGLVGPIAPELGSSLQGIAKSVLPGGRAARQSSDPSAGRLSGICAVLADDGGRSDQALPTVRSVTP